MTCLSVQDDLKAYADGELSLRRRLAVRRHLAGCAPCREEVQSMEALHKGLRAAEAPDAGLSADLRARILSRVADVTPLPTAHPPSRLLQYGFAGSLIVNCFFLLMLSRIDLHPVRRTSPPQPRVETPAQQPPAPAPHKPPQRVARPLPLSAPPRTIALSPSARPAVARPLTISPTPRTVPVRPVAPLASASPPWAIIRTPAVPPPGTQTSAADGPPSPAPAARRALASSVAQDRAAKQSAQAPPPAPPGQAAPSPPPAAPARAAGEAKASVPDRDTPTIAGDWAQVVLPTDSNLAALARTTVTADWAVDAQGRVSDIRFPPTGSPAVDEAVREALYKSHFAPAARGGVPVSGRMSHTFVVVP